MYEFIDVRMHVCMYVCVYACMYACMYACVYACMHVCMYVCMQACIYVCMYSFFHCFIRPFVRSVICLFDLFIHFCIYLLFELNICCLLLHLFPPTFLPPLPPPDRSAAPPPSRTPALKERDRAAQTAHPQPHHPLSGRVGKQTREPSLFHHGAHDVGDAQAVHRPRLC